MTNAVKAAATAAVKTAVALSTIDVIYDGTLNLDRKNKVAPTIQKRNTANRTSRVPCTSCNISGFTYDVTGQNMAIPVSAAG